MYIKNILSKILLAGWILFFIFSCIHEDFVIIQQEPEVPEGMVKVELYTNIPDYGYPTSRALADENAISTTPMVIVFEGTGGSAIFSQAAQSVYASGKTTVTLSGNQNPCIIMVVSGLPENKFFDGTTERTFDESNLQTVLTGKTLAQAEELLTTLKLTTPRQTTRPFPLATDVLPMSGITQVAHIDIDTKIGDSNNALLLTRAVAKVSVQINTGVMLLGAGMINVPRNGSVYRSGSMIRNNSSNLTDYLTNDAMGVMNMAPANSAYTSTAENPLYVYECRREEEPALVFYVMDLFGAGAGSGFYKLAFSNEGQLMDVERNKNYVFNIKTLNAPPYTTLDEAIASPPANLEYEITVTDANTYDMVSNGQYYLGVSNSQVIIYDDEALTIPDAFTISTDAWQALSLTTTISYTGVTGGSPTTVNLAPSQGQTGTTTVSVTMPANVNSGTATIQVGNLNKVVTFTRRSALSYSGYIEELPHDDYTTCEIVSTGTGDWLTPITNAQVLPQEYIAFAQPTKIYLVIPRNIETTGAVKRTGAQLYLTRGDAAGLEGRIKVLLSQAVLNTGVTEPEDPTSGAVFIGAFWKNSQTGERLVRIPYHTGMVGEWEAVAMDDWIIMDQQESSDPGITWNAATENPADMNNPANDALYQVTGGTPAIRGRMNNASEEIKFRIGLTSSYTGTAEAPNRYGRVIVRYNNGRKYLIIYIRQGENPDYLMRPTDPSTGVWTSNTRPLAKKFMPYNLTAPSYKSNPNSGGGSNVANHALLTTRGGTFVDYPTQIGAYFQWYNTVNPLRAYHPVNPSYNATITGWSRNANGDLTTWGQVGAVHETCPPGYRRPHDGLTTIAYPPDDLHPSISELRQSLFLTPHATALGHGGTNCVHGYYADGFYDRRKRVEAPTGDGKAESAVSVNNANVAYYGHLVYNPYNHASIFFPAGGFRNENDDIGRLSSGGHYGYYLTTTRIKAATVTSTSISRFNTYMTSLFRASAGTAAAGSNIRCVVE